METYVPVAVHHGTWAEAFQALRPEKQLQVQQYAYEAVARTVERIAGSIPLTSELGRSFDPASQFLKGNEVYLRKARRYLMRGSNVNDWAANDLAKTLAWKACNEVRDHLKKIRTGLRATTPIQTSPRQMEETHKYWIATVITYLESQKTKTARDAAVLLQYVWKHTSALTVTPKRGISFKIKAIAAAMTQTEHELWDDNRVQRARSFVLDEMSHFETHSVAEIVELLRTRVA
jgi:hypothetical protein